MAFEWYTVVEFKINGQRCYTELSAEDEDKEFQIDENGIHTCLASNAYWAFVTLEQAGVIDDLVFSNAKRYIPDDDEEIWTEFVGYAEDGTPMFETIRGVPEAN